MLIIKIMKMLFLDGESISMKRESLFFTASEDDSGLVESLLNSWWSTRETRYIRLIIYIYFFRQITIDRLKAIGTYMNVVIWRKSIANVPTIFISTTTYIYFVSLCILVVLFLKGYASVVIRGVWLMFCDKKVWG